MVYVTQKGNTMTEESVKTKVTTIAEEEEKSGKKLMPDIKEEEFVNMTHASHYRLMARVETLMKHMKAKDIRKSVVAALDIRQNDITTDWVVKTKDGPPRVKQEHTLKYELFQTLSRLQEAVLIITNYQTKQNMLKYMAEQQKNEEKTKDSSQNAEEDINNQPTQGV